MIPSSSLRLWLLLVVVVGILPAAVLTFYTCAEQRRQGGADGRREAMEVLRSIGATQQCLIRQGRLLLAGLARLPAVRQGDPKACQALFDGMFTTSRDGLYSNIELLDTKGHVVCSALPLTGTVNRSSDLGFQRALRTRGFAVGGYQFERLTGKAVLTFDYPIFDATNHPRAVLYAALNLGWIKQCMAQLKPPPGTSVMIAGRNDTVFLDYLDSAHKDARLVKEPPIVNLAWVRQTSGVVELNGLDGVPRLYAFAPGFGASAGTAGRLIVGVPATFAYAAVHPFANRSLAIFGGAVLMVLSVAWAGYVMLVRRGKVSAWAANQGAEANERRHLARELHDRVGESLTLLGLNLTLLQSPSTLRSPPELAARLEDSQRLVAETMTRIRNVIAQLRPPMLDDYGLSAALKTHAEQFSQRTGIPVSVSGQDSLAGLASEADDALFHIAREALLNVAKHAQADKVDVRVEEQAGQVILTIADNGVGFDRHAVRQAGRQQWGLTTMKERAKAVGAKFEIDSRLGEGTRVSVRIRRYNRGH